MNMHHDQQQSRLKALLADFNGINHAELAAKYGLSLQWVYTLLNDFNRLTFQQHQNIKPAAHPRSIADEKWLALKTYADGKRGYCLSTVADLETVMSYWHQQKSPLLIFYCIQDGMAQFDCYTPLYLVALAVPVSCECQALAQFDEQVRLPHTFVRHTGRSIGRR